MSYELTHYLDDYTTADHGHTSGSSCNSSFDYSLPISFMSDDYLSSDLSLPSSPTVDDIWQHDGLHQSSQIAAAYDTPHRLMLPNTLQGQHFDLSIPSGGVSPVFIQPCSYVVPNDLFMALDTAGMPLYHKMHPELPCRPANQHSESLAGDFFAFNVERSPSPLMTRSESQSSFGDGSPFNGLSGNLGNQRADSASPAYEGFETFTAQNLSRGSSMASCADFATPSIKANVRRALAKQARRTPRTGRQTRKAKPKGVASTSWVVDECFDESESESRRIRVYTSVNKDGSANRPLRFLKDRSGAQKPSKSRSKDDMFVYRCQEISCSDSSKQYRRREHLQRHFLNEHLKIGGLRCPLASCKLNKGGRDHGIRVDNMVQHLPTHVKDPGQKPRRNDGEGKTLEEVENDVTRLWAGQQKDEIMVRRLRCAVLRRRVEAYLGSIQCRAHNREQKNLLKAAIEANLDTWRNESTETARAVIVTMIAESLAPAMEPRLGSSKNRNTVSPEPTMHPPRVRSKL